jgi:hypothetical protein
MLYTTIRSPLKKGNPFKTKRRMNEQEETRKKSIENKKKEGFW